MESRLGRDFPPPITHPEHFYGFIGVALAWQILFLIVAKDPVRYRPIMIPAILEKLEFRVACIVLFLQGRLSSVTLGVSTVDLILAALFFVSYRATPTSDPPVPQQIDKL
jgi:predicted Abi (CAAX) family protease